MTQPQNLTTDEKTMNWDSICFPVKTVSMNEVMLPGINIIPRDKRAAVLSEINGEKNIYAIQSADYGLIPNSFIREIVDQYFTNYDLLIRKTKLGEFSMNIILSNTLTVGAEQLSQNIIINNSYTGKTQFSLQGSLVTSKKFSRIKVSYFRKICSNGLMGWADEFFTYDQYLEWLLNGKPKKYLDSLEEKVTIEEGEKRNEEKIISNITHKKIELDKLEIKLKHFFEHFKKGKHSVTGEMYKGMVKKALAMNKVEKLIGSIEDLPKQLAKMALERLEIESRMLNTDINAFLGYNAVNFALFNGKTSMTLADRYKVDEQAFQEFALLTV